MRNFKVRDFRNKQFFFVDDSYLNGYAKYLGVTASMVYFSLCRHANKDQLSFPSQKLIAEELGINERTVMQKLSLLKRWNIIKVVRTKNQQGKWINNTYILIDKNEWKPIDKPPAENIQVATTYINSTQPPVENIHIKETHNKETHNNLLSLDKSKDNSETSSKSYGNEYINYLLDYMKDKLNLPLLDGSIQQNRRYCYLAMKKFGGVDKVRLLIDLAANDSFWATRITSFITLYYKGVQLISKTREGGRSGGRKNLTIITPDPDWNSR